MGKTKVCTNCNREFSATNEYFHKAKLGKYGLTANCKDCQREYKRKHGEKNKDRLAGYNKNYYEENKEHCLQVRANWRKNNPDYFAKWGEENKEHVKEQDKRYYEENKQEINQYKKLWYEKNRQRIIKKNVNYKRSNKEKVRLWENKRRTLKAKLPSTLTHDQWERVIKDFNRECAYCGQEETLSQDHFVPLSKGGEFTHNNIIPACASCNSSKHANDFFEWYPTYKYYDRQREKRILDYLNYDKNKIQQLSIL